MVHLLLFIATECAFLFERGRFRFTDSGVATSFGGDAYVVLESNETRLRFVRDRSQMMCDFQPIRGGHAGDWFGLGPLRGVLLGDQGGSEVLDARWAAFLGSALDDLEASFSTAAGRQALVRELKRQERRRAQDLFG